jgi:hypothetical protein
MERLSKLWTSLTQTSDKPGFLPPPGFETPPLITAVLAHNVEAARDLLVHGADVNARDDLYHTSLQYAAMKGSVDMVQLLLDHGADIEARNNSGHSALTVAIASSEEHTAKMLMAKGLTTNSGELSEIGMAKYIRWMTDGAFLNFWVNLDLQPPVHRTIQALSEQYVAPIPSF